MSRYIVNGDDISAVANAIRDKTGKSDTMTLAEMPSEIESISGGGIEADDVNITSDGYAIMPMFSALSYEGKYTIPGEYKWEFRTSVSLSRFGRNVKTTDATKPKIYHMRFTDTAVANNLNTLWSSGNFNVGECRIYFEGNNPKPTNVGSLSTWGYQPLYIYGLIDLTDCTVAGTFISSSQPRHIELCPNTAMISIGATATLLDTATICYFANACNESVTEKTLTLPTNCGADTMMGNISIITDVNGNEAHLFTPSESGTVSLSDFVTNTKGWSLVLG